VVQRRGMGQSRRDMQPVPQEGRLQTRGWEDEEGKKHYRTEVVASEMIVLGDRRGGIVPGPDPDTETEDDEEDYAF
jgi:single-stranded DNA-binding protein